MLNSVKGDLRKLAYKLVHDTEVDEDATCEVLGILFPLCSNYAEIQDKINPAGLVSWERNCHEEKCCREDLIERIGTQLIDLRREREALQTDIIRHEAILEEMQRLEESFNGAIQAYGNIANVYGLFDERMRALEAQTGRQREQPEETKTPPEHEEQESGKLPSVDYEEVTSIEKLFRKYNGKISGLVIVIRTKNHPWSGGYCMAVKSVNDGKAWVCGTTTVHQEKYAAESR